jgi:molecular chaperone DnaK/molecular chaperone HscA
MPAGMPRVGVKFHIDADGVLTVTAKEESTGTAASIEVKPMHGLTDEEVDGMLRASFENAQADFDQRRVVELHTEIGTMLHAVDKNLAVAEERLDKETLDDLRSAAADAADARQATDLKTVQAARDRLEQATLPLAAVLMDAVVKGAVSGKKLADL